MGKLEIGTKVRHTNNSGLGIGEVIPVPERYTDSSWANDGRIWVDFDGKGGYSWSWADHLEIIELPSTAFKYNIGDSVKIIDSVDTHGISSHTYEKYIGTNCKIISRHVDRDEHWYELEEDLIGFHWHEECLEQIVEEHDESVSPIELQKNDFIKVFDYVNLRNCYTIVKIIHVDDDFYTCSVYKKVWMGKNISSYESTIMVPKIGTVAMDGEDSPRIELIG